MTEDRRKIINNYIQEKGEVKLKELEEMFPDVSSMTLRRDLTYLEKTKSIVRVRGGAKSIRYLTSQISNGKEEAYSLRAVANMEAKLKIAKKAVELIEPGRSIFIDSGTTTMCLAQILPDKNLSILTSGPNIALEIIKKHNPTVNVIGGQLNRDNISISGVYSLEFVKNFNVDIAFIVASAFSLESGFTAGQFDECELKKIIIKKARKTVLLMDLSKIDKNMTFTFATLKDIDILICDRKLPDHIIKEAEKNNVLIY